MYIYSRVNIYIYICIIVGKLMTKWEKLLCDTFHPSGIFRQK